MSDRDSSSSGAPAGSSAHAAAAAASGSAGSSSAGSSAGEPPHRATSAEEAEQEALDAAEAAANAQSWGAPSHALHGLLRKLGAGLDDLLPSISASHSKLKAILTGLKADDDGRQLVALNELCELLSIGTRLASTTCERTAHITAPPATAAPPPSSLTLPPSRSRGALRRH